MLDFRLRQGISPPKFRHYDHIVTLSHDPIHTPIYLPAMPLKFSSLLLTTLALITAAPSYAAPRELNAIAARVNDSVITESELDLMMLGAEAQMRGQFRGETLNANIKEARAKVLDDLIDREVILHEFSKLGGEIRSDYIDEEIKRIIERDYDGDRAKFFDYLKKANVTNRKFRDLTRKRLIVQAMRGRVSSQSSPATPFEIKDEYQKLANDMRKNGSIKMSKIFIPLTATGSTKIEQLKIAKEVRQKIIGGDDFADMARFYSRDSRAEDGGSWPEMPRSALKKELGDAAFSTPIGSVTPIIEDETGYHIILVEAREFGEVPPLDEIRSEVAKRVELKKRSEVYEKWMDSVRAKAVIRKY